MIKIWVDDERPIPKGKRYSAWCHSVNETIAEVARHNYEGFEEIMLDLDHDAGIYVDDGGDYINILKAFSQPWAGKEGQYFAEWYPLQVHFHSANPVGVKNMRAIVENCPWMEEAKNE